MCYLSIMCKEKRTGARTDHITFLIDLSDFCPVTFVHLTKIFPQCSALAAAPLPLSTLISHNAYRLTRRFPYVRNEGSERGTDSVLRQSLTVN